MTYNVPLPGHNIQDLASKMAKTSDLSSVINDEAVLTTQIPLLVADNAEASKNFLANPNSGELARMLYSDFFARYLDKANNNINKEKVLVGMGYSDVLKDLPKENNETLPVTPLSYSDNVDHEYSYRLDPHLAPNGRVGVEILQPFQEHHDTTKKSGVSSLSYVDTLPTAYLEGKVYHDASDLLTGLHNMENALIAKDINNSIKDRPDMSLKFVDKDGKFRSYILAYEGDWGTNSQSGSNRQEGSEPCIYISDLASDQESSSAGYVLREFCKRYKENYLSKENPIPIYAEMRESTSYQLVTENQNLLEKWIGAKINIEEVKSYQRGGGETMHVLKLSVEQ